MAASAASPALGPVKPFDPAAITTTMLDYGLHHLAVGRDVVGASTAGGRLVGQCMTMGYPPQKREALSAPFEESPELQVQSYSRSDAGADPDPALVRPPSVLVAVCEHLVENVIGARPRRDWDKFYKEKFSYVANRWRKVRQDWKIQCGDDPTDMMKDRVLWTSKMVKVLAMRNAICTRNVEDCEAFIADKKGNAEQLQDSIDVLATYFRHYPKEAMREAHTVALSLLFAGLLMNVKVEDRGSWCKATTTANGLCTLEPRFYAVDLAAVYRELAALPSEMLALQPIRCTLQALHALYEGQWFYFLALCRSLPFTFFQKCLLSSAFTYARFRAIAEIATKPRIIAKDGSVADAVPIVRDVLSLKDFASRGLFRNLRDAARFISLLGIECFVLKTPFDDDSGYVALTDDDIERNDDRLAYAIIQLQSGATVTMAQVVAEADKNRVKLVLPVEEDYFRLVDYRMDDAQIAVNKSTSGAEADDDDNGDDDDGDDNNEDDDGGDDPDYRDDDDDDDEGDDEEEENDGEVDVSSSSAPVGSDEEDNADEEVDADDDLHDAHDDEENGDEEENEEADDGGDDDGASDDDDRASDDDDDNNSEADDVDVNDMDNDDENDDGAEASRSTTVVRGRDIPVDSPQCPLDLLMILEEDAVLEERFKAQIEVLIADGDASAVPVVDPAEEARVAEAVREALEAAAAEADAERRAIAEALGNGPTLEATDVYRKYFFDIHSAEQQKVLDAEAQGRVGMLTAHQLGFDALARQETAARVQLEAAEAQRRVAQQAALNLQRRAEQQQKAQPALAPSPQPAAAAGAASPSPFGVPLKPTAMSPTAPNAAVKSLPPVIPVTAPAVPTPQPSLVAPAQHVQSAASTAYVVPDDVEVISDTEPEGRTEPGAQQRPPQPQPVPLAASRLSPPLPPPPKRLPLSQSPAYVLRGPLNNRARRQRPEESVCASDALHVRPVSCTPIAGLTATLGSNFLLWLLSARENLSSPELFFAGSDGADLHAQLTLLVLGDFDNIDSGVRRDDDSPEGRFDVTVRLSKAAMENFRPAAPRRTVHAVASMLAATPVTSPTQVRSGDSLGAAARCLSRSDAHSFASMAGVRCAIPSHVADITATVRTVALAFGDEAHLASSTTQQLSFAGIAVVVVAAGQAALETALSSLEPLLRSHVTGEPVNPSEPFSARFCLRGIVFVVEDSCTSESVRQLEQLVAAANSDSGRRHRNASSRSYQAQSSVTQDPSGFRLSVNNGKSAHAVNPFLGDDTPAAAVLIPYDRITFGTVPLHDVVAMGSDIRQAIADTIYGVASRCYPHIRRQRATPDASGDARLKQNMLLLSDPAGLLPDFEEE